MARKAVTGSAAFHLEQFAGPFVDGNNNVYVFDRPNTSEIRAWKAGSNPLVDTWSLQDSGAGPGATVARISCWQDGDTIHVVSFVTNTGVIWSEFHTSDHATLGDTWGTIEQVVEDPTNYAITPTVLMCVRSDGDRLVLYNGDTDKIMGTNYDRVDYGRQEDGGTTWTINNVAGNGAEEHFRARGIGRGESDAIYFLYSEGPIATNKAHFKRLQSNNTLDSQNEIDTITANDLVLPRFSPIVAYYDDGGVEVVSFCYADTGAMKSKQARDGTLQTRLDISNTAADGHPCLANDGTDLYCVYVDDVSSDVRYQKSADGASWSDETTLSTATAPEDISANVIDHGGGKVLAVVYDDGDIYYDEISISGAAAERVPTLTLLGVG